jgi:hypothetical protein
MCSHKFYVIVPAIDFSEYMYQEPIETENPILLLKQHCLNSLKGNPKTAASRLPI